MSARRARARVKPHKVRGRELEEVREKDPDGRIVYHHRTVDTLGKMLRAGTIDQAMHDAAKDFQAAFIVASSTRCGRCRSCGCRHRARAGAQRAPADAGGAVHQALAALGGISSPAGSCVWHVVGLQRASASGRSGRAGADGRSIRRRRGHLVAALGMLAAHFGYGEAKCAS